MITQDLVKELLHYNHKTGVFTWKERALKWFKSERSQKIWNSRYSGKETGYHNSHIGYVMITLFNKSYYAHRLAFLYMVNEMPEQVDHINHDRTDNRWPNLRQSSMAGNRLNMSKSKANTSGTTGVYWNSDLSKWQVKIGVEGKSLHVGVFDDLDDAIAARMDANKKYNFHPNHGN